MAVSTKEVALVIGASRGIGRQIAVDFAKQGYAVVIAAKSTSDPSKTTPFPPDPNSPASTISTVEHEIRSSGGDATAIPVDTRSYPSIHHLIAQTLSTYGHIDVLVYNSGAIWWSSVSNTPFSRFQLLQRVNIEGLYGVLSAAFPHFEARGWRARIVVVCPPIYSRFFRGKTAYAVGKVGMSVLVKGLAMDFRREEKVGMAVSGLWPATAVQSAATEKMAQEVRAELRMPAVFSDAVLAVVRAPVEEVNGELLVDEDFLREKGVCDFEKYSLVPGSRPRRIMPVEFPDLRVREQEEEGRRMDSVKLRAAKL
ncbi:similar to short chain dehydrogenase [Plenodomus lingam JN3]|uniref:Similar to short chain dehydrogenase n=1 Tax=Leptosphaeria maculans (strain JN3 / isolate v23.1.3 / race Av1-4-5-6-7-8) TaxID=985895 RepID=E4ZU47_LEPMJ|nr:similar to short chain dehydrogenase [Plenodomus lingam JN3]CBX94757.1 similar to short chain dehydrogenase [Plenodomus lingam JN3]